MFNRFSAFMPAFLALTIWTQFEMATAESQDINAAANAFAQAQRAELALDHARAAELYELADSIMEAPEALRNAARSWLLAERWVRAAGAAEDLLSRYSADPTSSALADEILLRTRPRLGRGDVLCASPCTLGVDGLLAPGAARSEHILYLEPGEHSVVAHFEPGDSHHARVEAQANQTFALTFDRASEPPKAPAPKALGIASPLSPEPYLVAKETPYRKRSRLPPIYFASFALATAGLGAVTIWSGIDLLQARDEFRSSMQPTREAFQTGEDKDLRTSILLGSTIVVAIAAVTLVFFTDFRKPLLSKRRGRVRRAEAPQAWQGMWSLGGRF